ncbi:MAG TPA: NAD-dependent epimerase/dehydratase family protein [Tepidisphaeraceae bacterium]|jgi:nucleoside-diphosphate-sugar epimerase
MQTATEIVHQDLEALRHSLKSELAKMAGSSVLITGGAGFLGYYLVQTLTHFNTTVDASQRIGVTVFDNLSRGLPPWLETLIGRKEVAFQRFDLREPLPAEMPASDWIIHAASIASPVYYRKDPIGTMDANINGLRNLLDHALKQKDTARPVRGFLFFSSSEIYGDPDPANIPTAEDYRGLVSCTGPRACYDEAKRYGETLCVNFAKQHNIPVKMARPFNNYGPGLKITDGRLIPDFARDILNNRDIVMLSDGSPTRTFCYSADSIQGYLKVLVNGGPGEPYNIGTETPEISVAELARTMIAIAKDLFGYKGQVVLQQAKEAAYLVDNPNRRCPIISKAREQIGYAPAVSLDEGLRRTMLWYAGNREGADQ